MGKFRKFFVLFFHLGLALALSLTYALLPNSPSAKRKVPTSFILTERKVPTSFFLTVGENIVATMFLFCYILFYFIF